MCRCALKADVAVVTQPVEGTGKARLALRRSPGLVAELTATLVGRDGSAIGLFGAGAEATVPVGEYRLGTVTLALTTDLEGSGPRKPSDTLKLRPGLFTAAGLLIVTSYRGTPTTTGSDDDGPMATIALADGDGRPLDLARSGFA